MPIVALLEVIKIVHVGCWMFLVQFTCHEDWDIFRILLYVACIVWIPDSSELRPAFVRRNF